MIIPRVSEDTVSQANPGDTRESSIESSGAHVRELDGRGKEIHPFTSVTRGENDRTKSDHGRSATSWTKGATTWRTELGRVIQGQILPRLLLAHDRDDRTTPIERFGDVECLDISEFAQRLIKDDVQGGWGFVSNLSAAGRATDEILLDILAPAARYLGELWESDHCDFIEVTVGLRRLQAILRRISPDEDESRDSLDLALHAMFLPTPGETHVFGVGIVETFFRSAGWRVKHGEADFLTDLGQEWFDVVGFSLSHARHVEVLRSAIMDARAASMNPSILVLVGGSLFVRSAALVETVGADATALDGPSAIHLAGSLLRRRSSR